MIETLANKKIVVMGLGRFGGGIAVSRWLCHHNARVTVTDTASADRLQASLAELDGLPITYRLGEHDPADLDDCDLLVVSPAVPKTKSDFVQEAIARSIPISSEMNLFIERCPARRIVGITGSAGKSTTTAMLGAIVEHPGSTNRARAWVGGNIGKSLLDNLDRMGTNDVVVLELSSFQLEDLARLAWSPHIGLITNLQPNHLDRHGTFEAYRQAKFTLVNHQGPKDYILVHQDNQELLQAIEKQEPKSQIVQYQFDPRFSDSLRLSGRHNRDNAAAAIAIARLLNIDDASIHAGLAEFNGLPHRLEYVTTIASVDYYNDSKSTTPESSQLALEAFDRPVIMLLGGKDKGAPFDRLAERLADKSKGVICYGVSGPVIHRAVHEARLKGAGQCHMELVDDLSQAVARARQWAEPGDVVVLSPACTSYDQFDNYEQRGDTYRQLLTG